MVINMSIIIFINLKEKIQKHKEANIHLNIFYLIFIV